MKVEGSDCASLHFSTRGLPPAKRLPALRELFDQSIRLTIDAEPGHAVEMTMHLAPGLRRARMMSPLTARVTRAAPRLSDGEDTVCLMMKTGGRMALTQGGRESVPEVGEGVLLVYREPAILQFEGATYLSVRVPFGALATLANAEGAAARRIPRESEALSLLRAYVETLPERFDDPQLARLSATHVLVAIKSALAQNAALTLDQLAACRGISPRYVQMLFEEAGTTFSAFALEQKLLVARSMLTSPRYAAWSVAAIALEAGFGDLSHFNRRFKRRYLMTPTDLRRQLECGQRRRLDSL